MRSVREILQDLKEYTESGKIQWMELGPCEFVSTLGKVEICIRVDDPDAEWPFVYGRVCSPGRHLFEIEYYQSPDELEELWNAVQAARKGGVLEDLNYQIDKLSWPKHLSW